MLIKLTGVCWFFQFSRCCWFTRTPIPLREIFFSPAFPAGQLNSAAHFARQKVGQFRKMLRTIRWILSFWFRILDIFPTTDYYLEFYSGRSGELEIRPSGTDFFGEAREELLKDVTADDVEKVRELTGKAALMKWVDQEEAVALPFHKLKGGMPEPYSLEMIKTRESDDYHIVIGVRQA